MGTDDDPNCQRQAVMDQALDDVRVGVARHPILEDNVIVYSNATILGRITIGRDATVGGNIWVTENVPAGARIVQTKAKK